MYEKLQAYIWYSFSRSTITDFVAERLSLGLSLAGKFWKFMVRISEKEQAFEFILNLL